MDGEGRWRGYQHPRTDFCASGAGLGHMLSTLLRTIPAISLDVMAADFKTPPQTLASLTSIYHFALLPRKFRSAPRWIASAYGQFP